MEFDADLAPQKPRDIGLAVYVGLAGEGDCHPSWQKRDRRFYGDPTGLEAASTTVDEG